MPASMHTAAADALARAVVALRKGAGLTQRQLAAAVGREQSYVARIEQGQRRVDLIEWVEICRAVGVDPQAEVGRIVGDVVPLIPQKRRATKA
jgi:transcriptional regulator with XRE-family HTH domain